MNIALFPGFNASYYSYYLLGLIREFGTRTISYSVAGYPALHPHALALKARIKGLEKKIYISAGDGSGVNTEGLEWCDVYAKVNIDSALPVPLHAEKLFPIGPSFGIRYLSLIGTLITSIRSFFIARNMISQPREHFANYFRQWRYRLPFEVYHPVPSQPNYLFFMAAVWRKEQFVNRLRAAFMQVGRSVPGLEFEGGFAPGKEEVLPAEYIRLVASRRYPLGEYLSNLQRSVVAFNTPAVQHCLGWKLAEFLALGKAIISTPLTRRIPAPLEHGRHIHYVKDNPEDIRAALIEISQNHNYRQRLEKGAREYYASYLHPQRVIRRIFDYAGIQ